MQLAHLLREQEQLNAARANGEITAIQHSERMAEIKLTKIIKLKISPKRCRYFSGLLDIRRAIALSMPNRLKESPNEKLEVKIP